MDIEHSIIKEVVHVKVHYLNKIDNIEDINARLINFCKNLLLEKKLDTEFLNTILMSENNIENIFNIKFEKHDTRFLIDTIYKLIDINESMIYYYSLYKGNSYKEFHEFGSIISDLNNRILPKYFLNKIHKLQNNINELKSNIENDLNINPENEGFWEINKIDNSTRINRIEDINKELEFVEVSNSFCNKFNENINEKIARNLKTYNRLLIKQIQEEFNVDEDYNCYSISNRGFRKLLHQVKLINEPMIDYNISDKIDNDTISKILYIFPEIVLDFSLMESRPFFKNYDRQKYNYNGVIYQEPKFIGKLKVKKVVLRVHEKAHFTNKEETLLYKLLDKLSIDKKLYNKENKIFVL